MRRIEGGEGRGAQGFGRWARESWSRGGRLEVRGEVEIWARAVSGRKRGREDSRLCGESWTRRETGGGVSWACGPKGREGRGLDFLSFFQNLFKFEILFKLFLKFSNHLKNF
jgi:hypothetical protein